MNSIPTAPATPSFSWLKRSFGYLLAAVSLVWVFHDIRIEELPGHISNINWGWVALAIWFDILTYICQGWRWRLLLHPMGNLSSLRATQAVYAGLFTNEVLPMRFGELVRAYLVSRWVGVDFSAVIPSMIVERLLDGVWLAVGIGVTAIFVPLPRDVLEAGDILGAVMLSATGLFVYVVLRKEKELGEAAPRNSAGSKPSGRVGRFVSRLAQGLRQIGLSRSFYVATTLSLIMLILQALAFWLIMWAYGLRLSFWIGAVVFLVVHLGTILPNAPANVGTYQFFCVVGLTLFGIDKTVAAGFSLVVFVLLTIPLWVIGSFALMRSGTSLYAIRNEINRLMAELKMG